MAVWNKGDRIPVRIIAYNVTMALPHRCENGGVRHLDRY